MKKDKRKPKPKSVPKPARSHVGIALLVLLAALTVAVYWQAVGFELNNFDDVIYVSDNPRVLSGLNRQGVEWAFSTFHACNWHPLTWISLMMDAQRGNGSPGTYYATNIVLHVLNVMLLYLALSVATKSIWHSAFVAALFAIHPLHAESVAWVAERKDVLSTLFWMLTMLVYARYAGRLTRRTHALLVVVFAVGLLAKPMLVSLPLVLLMMDYWPLARGQGRPNTRHLGSLILEKLPLIVLAVASCGVTYWAQRTGGAVRPFEAYPIGVRLANAAVAYVSYLGKTIWPANLSPFYPHTGTSLPTWQVVGSTFVLAAMTLIAIKYRRKAPYVFVGWFWYVITLIPVIGVIQVGDQAMADRYTYVPLIGIFIMLAWAIPALAYAGARDESRTKTRARALGVVGAAVVLALAIAGHRQVSYWRTSKTLFGHAIRVDPRNALAYNSYGAALIDDATADSRNVDKKMLGEAIRKFRKSLEIKPDYLEALYNLGTALGRSGETPEALEVMRKALKIDPNAPKAHNNMGMILLTRHEYHQAETHFRAAVRSNPNLSQAYNNLSYSLYQQGRYEEVIQPAMKALEIDPGYLQARVNIGNALLCLQRYEEAIQHYKKVTEVDPARASIRNNMAAAFEQLGRTDEAMAQLRTALEYDPNNAVIRSSYERMLAAQKARR